MLSFGRMPPGRDSGPIRFGQFELDITTGELRKRGVKLNLPDQAFQVLRALLECRRSDDASHLGPQNGRRRAVSVTLALHVRGARATLVVMILLTTGLSSACVRAVASPDSAGL